MLKFVQNSKRATATVLMIKAVAYEIPPLYTSVRNASNQIMVPTSVLSLRRFRHPSPLAQTNNKGKGKGKGKCGKGR
jgi:hypothetical protein